MSGAAPKKVDYERLVEKLNDLPTLPTVVYELNAIINNPMSSLGKIESIMEKDQAITTKVLRMANSAYYGVRGGVTKISRAVTCIGLDAVNQLVLSASVVSAFKVKGPQKFDFNLFWKHALGVGITAETIAIHLKMRNASDAFTCGLLHDAGKLVTFMIDQESFFKMIDVCKEEKISSLVAEVKHELPRHTDIGYLLTKKWNLPMAIQKTVLYHHQADVQRRSQTAPEISKIIDLVMTANLIMHEHNFGNSGHEAVEEIPQSLLQRLEVKPEDLEALKLKIKANLSKADDFLKIINE